MSLRAYLSQGTPESSKRLIAFGSAVVLCTSVAALTFAIVWQSLRHWSVDGALITALTFVVGFVAALAQQVYKKPDIAPTGDASLGAGTPVPGGGDK